MYSKLIYVVTSCLLISSFIPKTSASQSPTWIRVFNTSNPHTIGINPANPNSLYAEGGGYLNVSFDRGQNWMQLGITGLNEMRQVLVHPSDTMIILSAAFSGGLRRSTDYGATWNTVLADFGIDGESIVYDPVHPDTMFAGNFNDGKVYMSTNRGQAWMKCAKYLFIHLTQ